MIHTLLIVMCAATCLAASADDIQFAKNVRAQGEIANHLSQVYDRLTSPPLNNLDFVLSDLNFALARRFTEYSGDISGRMLAALDDVGPLIGKKDDAFISTLLEGIEQYQKSDGHFGVDQNLDEEVSQKRDMPILWGNGRLLFALGRYSRHHPDEKLQKIAEQLGNYICAMRKYYGKEDNFRAVGGVYASGFTTCYPSVVDGLVAVADKAGRGGDFNKKYADEARFIAKLSFLDDAFDKHHSHGRLTTYRGMLDLDWLTGTNDFVNKVRNYCAKITNEYQMPTGGVTEIFDRNYGLDEGCTEADWLWVQLLLWRATDDPAYLDAAEHILRNHLLATQFPNGGFGHRPLRRMKLANHTFYGCGFASLGMESYWCCSMHGAQALAQIAQYGVLQRGHAITITWLAEVTGDFDINGQALHVTMRRMGPVNWEVHIKADKPRNIRLRLRVPGWADSVQVDKNDESASNGWLELQRNIVDEQVIKVSFTTQLRQQGVYTSNVTEDKPVRLFYGPDMYCLPDVFVNDGLLAKNEVPTIIIANDKPSDDYLSVAIENSQGQRQQARLVPLASRPIGGCRHVFNVRRLDRQTMDELFAKATTMPKVGTPVILTILCDGEYELYLNGQPQALGQPTPAERMLETYGQEGDNIIALRIRSSKPRPGFIGTIRVGDQVYVTDAEHWSVAKESTTQPADWMTNAIAEMTGMIEIDDLGPWGVDPWKYISAQYADTGARWIWSTDYETGTWYTMRYVFMIP